MHWIAEREKKMENNAGAAPATGCYKCGRPGHWSRDCPLSSTNPNPSSIPNSKSLNTTNFSGSSSFKTGGGGGGFQKPFVEKTTEKPKKAPRTRPKLTPELFLSNDGLGYVLRHFPRSFKCRGRGHEVSDLGNLIGLYTQWHSRLLPYYSFDQFVQKVEQVGATRRVRMCIRELRERVANGGDPSKLHESSVEHNEPNREPEEANNLEEPSPDVGDPMLESRVVDMEEEMLDEVYKEATAEPCETLQRPITAEPQVLSEPNSSMRKSPNQVSDNGARTSSNVQITDEMRARMEANRLKALQRAAARAGSSQAA